MTNYVVKVNNLTMKVTRSKKLAKAYRDMLEGWGHKNVTIEIKKEEE